MRQSVCEKVQLSRSALSDLRLDLPSGNLEGLLTERSLHKSTDTGGVDIASQALVESKLVIFGVDLISRTLSLIAFTD